jgi:hypothetical protein
MDPLLWLAFLIVLIVAEMSTVQSAGLLSAFLLPFAISSFPVVDSYAES